MTLLQQQRCTSAAAAAGHASQGLLDRSSWDAGDQRRFESWKRRHLGCVVGNSYTAK